MLDASLRRSTAVAASAMLLVSLVSSACGSTTGQSPSSVPTAGTTASSAPSTGASGGSSPSAASPSTGASVEPSAESGGVTTAGDIPDNAVFLTFHGTNPVFSIQYVEGWQVTPQSDGVAIRDKDSSETVAIVSTSTDPATYTSQTLLPALRAMTGFSFVKQTTQTIAGQRDIHLVYHLPSPPDPVTGKQVPSTVDAYVVAGTGQLAIISLSTPDGVDNVDAFRRMIESFRWT